MSVKPPLGPRGVLKSSVLAGKYRGARRRWLGARDMFFLLAGAIVFYGATHLHLLSHSGHAHVGASVNTLRIDKVDQADALSSITASAAQKATITATQKAAEEAEAARKAEQAAEAAKQAAQEAEAAAGAGEDALASADKARVKADASAKAAEEAEAAKAAADKAAADAEAAQKLAEEAEAARKADEPMAAEEATRKAAEGKQSQELAAGLSERPKGATSRDSKDKAAVNFQPFKEGCSINIFMVWSTGADNWDLRYRRGIESVFYHMPNACVRMLSDTLTDRTFQQFTDAGYHVEVKGLKEEYTKMFKGLPLEAWAAKDRSKEPFLYTNLTNALRFATLYRYGGMYLDTDVIIVKSLLGLQNAVSVEDGDVKRFKRLNGAIMVFDKGAPVLRKMMDDFVRHYDGYWWGQNGPRVVTDVAKREVKGPKTIQVLPKSAFYPLFYEHFDVWFSVEKKPVAEQEKKYKELLDKSYCVHYWNKFSYKYTPNKGTVMHHLFNDFCLFCDEKIEADDYKTPAIGKNPLT